MATKKQKATPPTYVNKERGIEPLPHKVHYSIKEYSTLTGFSLNVVYQLHTLFENDTRYFALIDDEGKTRRFYPKDFYDNFRWSK